MGRNGRSYIWKESKAGRQTGREKIDWKGSSKTRRKIRKEVPVNVVDFVHGFRLTRVRIPEG